MKTIFRNTLASCVVGVSLFSTVHAQQIQQPGVGSKTAFAIVVDEVTYKNAKVEIDAYRKAVEHAGLGTYIISHQWTRPEEIRTILKDLYGRKQQLEGTVLIGDIPVPMIRDAQYLTSIFKMNQRLNWQRSSVPSDRFYDDFHLEFDFLKQDTAKKNYFYYSINPEGAQHIQMDIYSARIKPPVVEGKDKYQLIREYLTKVVAEKKTQNKIDDVFISVAHGYNSESPNAWGGEQLAFKGQFPNLFRPGNQVKFFNYLSSPFLKFSLLSALKNENLDMAIMHGHGSTDMQMLNGYPDVSHPQGSIENLTRYLRSKVRSAKEDGRDVQAVKDGFVKKLGVSMAWMDDSFDPKSIEMDSIFNHNLDIHISDIRETKPNARFVVLNNCLTGSFHLEDYLAGHYPFSEGKNIVTVGNSVGVWQDLWPAQLLGVLQHGSRVGNWFKHIAYLETHIMGDPTFSFKAASDFDVNQAIVLSHDAVYWKNMLKKQDADLQALALIYLSRSLKEAELSEILKESYFNSGYETTRTQAFVLLEKLDNAAYKEVLKAAVKDPYEYIRRKAIDDISENGGDEFLPEVMSLIVNDAHSERIAYNLRSNLTVMNSEAYMKALKKEITADKLSNAEEVLALYEKNVKSAEKSVKNIIDTLLDATKSDKVRLGDITTMRAYRYHQTIPTLVSFVKNKANADALRLAALEVLSWYPKSYRKEEILKLCKEILENDGYNADLKKQAKKNINIFS